MKYAVLYTKHKTQKRKIWNDGFLEFKNSTKKALLTDAETKKILDTVYCSAPLETDQELECEKFLVQVDTLVDAGDGVDTAPPPPRPVPGAPDRPGMATLPRRVGRLRPVRPSVQRAEAPASAQPTEPESGLLRADFAQPRQPRSAQDILKALSGVGEDTATEEQAPPMNFAPTTLTDRHITGSAPAPKNSILTKRPPMSGINPGLVGTKRRGGLVSRISKQRAVTSLEENTSCPEKKPAPLGGRNTDEILGLMANSSGIVAPAPTAATPAIASISAPKALHLSICEHDLEGMVDADFDYCIDEPERPAPPPLDDNPLPQYDNPPVSNKHMRKFRPVVSSSMRPVATQAIHESAQKTPCNVLRFVFPSKSVGSETEPQRTVFIPSKFNNLKEYAKTLLECTYEEINLHIHERAKVFWRAYASACVGDIPSCQHGIAKVAFVNKEGKNKGRGFFACSQPRGKQCSFFKWVDEVSRNSNSVTKKDAKPLTSKDGNDQGRAAILRSQGISYYFNCEIVQNNLQFQKKFGPMGRINQGNMKPVYCLKVPTESLENYKEYAKDDLWVLSSSPSFDDQEGSIQIAHSTFYSPGKDGMIEIESLDSSSLGRRQNIYAMKISNIGYELSMIENIKQLVRLSPPISRNLLGNYIPAEQQTRGLSVRSKWGMDLDELAEITDRFATDYCLNEDQRKVLEGVSSWFRGEESDPNEDIVLVHGVFGSGKSYLLVVIILFISHLAKDLPGGDSVKILVSSSTNVAVDRVLLGLLDHDFHDFMRVGSLRKIAKPLLKYTSTGKLKENGACRSWALVLVASVSQPPAMLEELRSMMASESSGEGRRFIQEAIKNIKSGNIKERQEMIRKVSVVGVTCHATVFPILSGVMFPIVFLDECSQMTECSSLMPIIQFGCQKLVLVGDPKQLPPTGIFNPAPALEAPNTSARNDVSKSMFERLADGGLDPILLRTQYRCHPMIGAVASDLFYDGRLLSGVDDEHRSAIIPSTPPISIVNVDGVETSGGFGSVLNEMEARTCCDMVRLLLQRDISPSELGVIALYKAQADRIRLLLEAPEDGQDPINDVKVSTVDAFQGAERDVILVSCARTDSTSAFAADPRRMNVAITRAKYHLFIVGKVATLKQNPLWAKLVEKIDNSRPKEEQHKTDEAVQFSGVYQPSHDNPNISNREQDIDALLDEEEALMAFPHE